MFEKSKEFLVQIPGYQFLFKYEQAVAATPTNYRSYGATTKKKAWRKKVTSLRPEKEGGYRFEGQWLEAGEETYLSPGDLVLAFDSLYVNENFYAEDRYLNGFSRIAQLFQVNSDGTLELIKKSGGKAWPNTLFTAAKKRLAA